MSDENPVNEEPETVASPSERLDRLFRLREHGTTIGTELIAGATTFFTMAYIIFVQPMLLSLPPCGMNFKAVMVATCLASALATLAMAFLANYPIALAPAMGHNVYFVFTVCAIAGITWRQGLGATFIAGCLFIILSAFDFRRKVMESVPLNLQYAIAAGIGLLIAMLGLQWGGLVVKHPATMVTLGKLNSAVPLLCLGALAVTCVLMVWRVKGALLLGILAGLLGAMLVGLSAPPKSVGDVVTLDISSRFAALGDTFLKMDPLGAITKGIFGVIFILFMLDLFDTVGTLTGVAHQAGLMTEDGKLPRGKEALLSDAIGTVAGAALGTSTVTSYIESSAGVSQGGRTGLANIMTALLFILALFFSPLIEMIGRNFSADPTVFLNPVVAPVLIIVGSLMMRSTAKINWEDYTEAIPCFLAMVLMPLTFSITDGIAFGFISMALLKLISGREEELNWVVYVVALAFIGRYVYMFW